VALKVRSASYGALTSGLRFALTKLVRYEIKKRYIDQSGEVGRSGLPIFDSLVPVEDVWPADAQWPMRRARATIAKFQAKFPRIHYDLYWETRLLNAQAFIGSQGRCVRLFGGLGRHRKVGVAGIAFALAHETGHHVGGPPYHPFYSCLSSEERADEWAASIGLPLLFGEVKARRYVDRGLSQLAAAWSRNPNQVERTCNRRLIVV
jgi:hypothetical protein